MSVCVFLAPVFLTGDGRFSRDTGGLIIIWGSSSLASVDWLSQTFSVTVRKKRSNNGDGHANVKREIGLDWQNNNFARAPRFLVKYDVKVPNFTKNSTPEEFAYTWQSKLVGIITMKIEKPRIHHFHIDHNASCLLPQILHIHCFQFLLGNTVVPREIKYDSYAKLWGGGGGLTRCIMVYVEMVNSLLRDVSPTSLSPEKY